MSPARSTWDHNGDAFSLRFAFEIALRLPPCLQSDGVSGRSADEVTEPEMYSTIAPRNSGFIGSIVKTCPSQCDWCFRRDARFDHRATGGEDHRISEALTAGEQSKDGRSSRAERAVSGY